MGAMFVTGMVTGCVTLTRMADIYGRKPIFMFGIAMQVFMVYFILSAQAELFTYLLVYLIGFSQSAK